MPPWFAPPQGTLPGVVGLELVVACTEKVAVCVGRLAAYPTGFELELVTMTSPDSEGLDPGLFGPRATRRGPGRGDQGIPEGMLRFGVQFADGSKATNTAIATGPPDFESEPAGPVLRTHGGGGGGGNWRQTMWVWPLPSGGPLTFVVEWPAAAIPLTRHEVDAQLILDAAKRAQVVFAEDDLPMPPAPAARPGWRPPPQARSG
jgi:hypothetical protein